MSEFFLELFSEEIPPKLQIDAREKIKQILEIGCGTGVYPIKLKELFSDIEYTGTDISETAIKQCKKNNSTKKCKQRKIFY